MYLQDNVLKSFKENFPNLTLNEISKLTGIEKTRVFRILNGCDMRVSELEIFDQLNTEYYGASNVEFLNVAKSCLKILKSERLNHLLWNMKHDLTIAKLTAQF